MCASLWVWVILIDSEAVAVCLTDSLETTPHTPASESASSCLLLQPHDSVTITAIKTFNIPSNHTCH